MKMGSLTLVAMSISILGSMGCNTECGTITENNSAAVPFDQPKPLVVNEPPEIPATSKMSTVIGPLVADPSKWGPDEMLPFSWPGRAMQLDVTNVSHPNEQLIYEIRLPEESTLYEVKIWVEPRKGHIAVPTNRVQAMVWYYNGGFKTSELLTPPMLTLGDSVVDYEQRYLITGQLTKPLTITSDSRVFVYVFGESGENTTPGLIVETPEVVFDDP